VSNWGAAKARLVFAALVRIGWTVKRPSSSHRTLARDGWPDYFFAFDRRRRNRSAYARPHREAYGTHAGRPVSV
jgi:hypothetical protein